VIDEVIDERACFLRDFRLSRHAPTWATGVGIKACKPWDQAATEQRKPLIARLRDRRIIVGCLEGLLHRSFDRTLDPTERLVVGERQLAIATTFEVEPLQREGEQRQRILGLALVDVGEQCIDQTFLDLEFAFRAH
jgi:hypothetical protein